MEMKLMIEKSFEIPLFELTLWSCMFF